MKRTSKKLKASNLKRYVVLEYDRKKDIFVFQNLHRPSELRGNPLVYLNVQ